MPLTREQYSVSPESMLVGLARNGDRDAYAELVQRRQAWVRSLMRRCSGDVTLADDLAQQVFLQGWLSVRQLQQPGRFGGWLKRISINVWLQYLRKNDPLRDASEHEDNDSALEFEAGMSMDLDRALATLPATVRLCVVLSYHEGMKHREISRLTGLPPGTVKSHIRRGAKRLRTLLSAYNDSPRTEKST